MKFVSRLIAAVALACASLIAAPALAAPAYYQPIASIAALKANGAGSAGILHAHIPSMGDYDWQAGCGGTPDDVNYVSATGQAVGCWALVPAGSTFVINSFAAAAAGNIVIPSPVTKIRTRYHTTAGYGGAEYDRDDATVTSSYVTAHPKIAFRLKDEAGATHGYLLSKDQTLTFEMFGAPADGWIGTAAISGTALTVSATQAGTLAAGQSLTAAGGTGAVSAGTSIVSGSGSNWVVNNSQTVSSTVMVAADAYPFVAEAMAFTPQLEFRRAHYFSQTLAFCKAHDWVSRQGGYFEQAFSYPAFLQFPAGYVAAAVLPTNRTINAQGDVSDGTCPTAIQSNSIGVSFRNIEFKVGGTSTPATTVNLRPAVRAESVVNFENSYVLGADGDGVLFDTTSSLANVNGSIIRGLGIQASYRDCMRINGNDSNTLTIEAVWVHACGASYLRSEGNLGNKFGQIQGSTGAVNNFVIRSGEKYFPVSDNLNADPLTNPAIWVPWAVSGLSDTWDPAKQYYASTAAYFSGGSNASSIDHFYAEGDTPPPLFKSNNSGLWLTHIGETMIGSTLNSGRPLTTVNGSIIGGWTGCAFGKCLFINATINTQVPGSTRNGDADATVTPSVSTQEQVWDTPLTANRVLTLGTLNQITGSWFRIVRLPSATGSQLRIQQGSSVICALAPGQSCVVSYNSGWTLVSFNDALYLTGVTYNGDVSLSPQVWSHTRTQVWSTPLTANRTVTLSSTLAVSGSTFEFVRAAAAIGASTLNIGGGLCVLAAGQSCVVRYDGSAWQLISFNNLAASALAGAATSSGLTLATSRLLGRTTAASGAIEEISAGSGLSLSAGSLALGGSLASSGLTMSTAKLIGRTTASTGAPEEIAAGSGLSLSAGSLAVSGAATSSGLTMSSARLLGRTTAASGAIEEISAGTGIALSGGTISSAGPRVVALADATSITLNADTTDIGTQTNTQAVGTLTINAPTGTLSNRQRLRLSIKSTNVETFAWDPVFIASNDNGLPTATTGSAKTDELGFEYDSGLLKWKLLAKNFGF